MAAVDAIAAMFDLTGKTILVTGGASGIGLAIADIVAAAGARVFLTDVDDDALHAQLLRLQQDHRQIDGVKLDVSEAAAVEATVEALISRYGRLNCVFANAGISAGRGFASQAGQLDQIDGEAWDRVMSVNLDGVMHTMRAAARHMKLHKNGRIVVTSSIAGLRAEPMSGYAYVVAKAAVNNLVRQAALELAPYNVLVNAIAPGPFATGINQGRLRQPEVVERLRGYVPLGRVADPDEIKGLALLLASDASAFMTGAIIPIDGGMSLGAVRSA